MQLASQVAGALLAGTLVLVFVWQSGARGRWAFGAIAVVPVAVACLLALPNLRDSMASLLEQRKANLALSAEEAQLQGGTASGVNVAFLSWVEAHFGEGETFHLAIGGPSEPEAVMQWSLFQLAPHIAVEEPASADWLVFYDAKRTGYTAGMLGELEIYAPGFAVARNRLAR